MATYFYILNYLWFSIKSFLNAYGYFALILGIICAIVSMDFAILYFIYLILTHCFLYLTPLFFIFSLIISRFNNWRKTNILGNKEAMRFAITYYIIGAIILEIPVEYAYNISLWLLELIIFGMLVILYILFRHFNWISRNNLEEPDYSYMD